MRAELAFQNPNHSLHFSSSVTHCAVTLRQSVQIIWKVPKLYKEAYDTELQYLLGWQAHSAFTNYLTPFVSLHMPIHYEKNRLV